MRFRIPVFALAVSLGMPPDAISQPSPAGSPEVLTLERAIALATQENRSLKGAHLEVKKFDDKLAELRTRRFPTLGFTTFASYRMTELNFRFPRGAFGLYPGIGPVPATEMSIVEPAKPAALLVGKIGQPLSQQYQISLGLRQLKLGREIAEERGRAQKQTIVDQVKRLYYGILQTQSALESLEESIRLYRELDRLTGEYVVQQVALKAQNLEVKTRLAKAEYEALGLRNPLATQKEQLNSLLGRDIQTEFSVSPVAEASWVEMDLAAARKLALERRPELREARLKATAAEADRSLKKADYIPEVSLMFHYLSPVNYGKLVPTRIAGIGLFLDWEPFDWGRKKHTLDEKSKTVQQAALAVKEVENQILVEVGSKFRKLQETRQLLTVSRLAQETARENLRVTMNRYQQEAALLKDVLQGQASLMESNHQYQQAVLAFWAAKADFERALGEDQ